MSRDPLSSECPGMGGTGPRCHEAICDCFIDTHPENPTGLYPQDFIVTFPPKPHDNDGRPIDTNEPPF